MRILDISLNNLYRSLNKISSGTVNSYFSTLISEYLSQFRASRNENGSLDSGISKRHVCIEHDITKLALELGSNRGLME